MVSEDNPAPVLWFWLVGRFEEQKKTFWTAKYSKNHDNENDETIVTHLRAFLYAVNFLIKPCLNISTIVIINKINNNRTKKIEIKCLLGWLKLHHHILVLSKMSYSLSHTSPYILFFHQQPLLTTTSKVPMKTPGTVIINNIVILKMFKCQEKTN